jgi:hypothetical protein
LLPSSEFGASIALPIGPTPGGGSVKSNIKETAMETKHDITLRHTAFIISSAFGADIIPPLPDM